VTSIFRQHVLDWPVDADTADHGRDHATTQALLDGESPVG
jgi:hypothetical protein